MKRSGRQNDFPRKKMRVGSEKPLEKSYFSPMNDRGSVYGAIESTINYVGRASFDSVVEFLNTIQSIGKFFTRYGAPAVFFDYLNQFLNVSLKFGSRSIKEIFSQHPNIIGPLISLLIGQSLGYVLGAFVGGKMWPSSDLINSLYTTATFGLNFSTAGLAGAVVGTGVVGNLSGSFFGELADRVFLFRPSKIILRNIIEKSAWAVVGAVMLALTTNNVLTFEKLIKVYSLISEGVARIIPFNPMGVLNTFLRMDVLQELIEEGGSAAMRGGSVAVEGASQFLGASAGWLEGASTVVITNPITKKIMTTIGLQPEPDPTLWSSIAGYFSSLSSNILSIFGYGALGLILTGACVGAWMIFQQGGAATREVANAVAINDSVLQSQSTVNTVDSLERMTASVANAAEAAPINPTLALINDLAVLQSQSTVNIVDSLERMTASDVETIACFDTADFVFSKLIDCLNDLENKSFVEASTTEALLKIVSSRTCNFENLERLVKSFVNQKNVELFKQLYRLPISDLNQRVVLIRDEKLRITLLDRLNSFQTTFETSFALLKTKRILQSYPQKRIVVEDLEDLENLASGSGLSKQEFEEIKKEQMEKIKLEIIQEEREKSEKMKRARIAANEYAKSRRIQMFEDKTRREELEKGKREAAKRFELDFNNRIKSSNNNQQPQLVFNQSQQQGPPGLFAPPPPGLFAPPPPPPPGLFAPPPPLSQVPKEQGQVMETAPRASGGVFKISADLMKSQLQLLKKVAIKTPEEKLAEKQADRDKQEEKAKQNQIEKMLEKQKRANEKAVAANEKAVAANENAEEAIIVATLTKDSALEARTAELAGEIVTTPKPPRAQIQKKEIYASELGAIAKVLRKTNNKEEVARREAEKEASLRETIRKAKDLADEEKAKREAADDAEAEQLQKAYLKIERENLQKDLESQKNLEEDVGKVIQSILNSVEGNQ